MCSGRVDLEFIFRAFAKGQDGVFIGGCKLDECNYITHGNYDALANSHIAKKMLEYLGINPARLRIEFMSGADGGLLAEKTDEFTDEIKSLGALGEAEGIDPADLALKLQAARNLVPYMRLVERERLRVGEKTKTAYTEFFQSADTAKLLEEILPDKLAMGQMMLLLGENPMSTSDIAARLGLNPSDVSRHMNTASRQGMVRYDTASNCYTLAVQN